MLILVNGWRLDGGGGDGGDDDGGVVGVGVVDWLFMYGLLYLYAQMIYIPYTGA